jgi:hypothetical protein
MTAVKGIYNGNTVILERIFPAPQGCEVIVTFPDLPVRKTHFTDDGTLAALFKNYVDDGLREPLIDFGEAVGNEQS